MTTALRVVPIRYPEQPQCRYDGHSVTVLELKTALLNGRHDTGTNRELLEAAAGSLGVPLPEEAVLKGYLQGLDEGLCGEGKYMPEFVLRAWLKKKEGASKLPLFTNDVVVLFV